MKNKHYMSHNMCYAFRHFRLDFYLHLDKNLGNFNFSHNISIPDLRFVSCFDEFTFDSRRITSDYLFFNFVYASIASSIASFVPECSSCAIKKFKSCSAVDSLSSSHLLTIDSFGEITLFNRDFLGFENTAAFSCSIKVFNVDKKDF